MDIRMKRDEMLAALEARRPWAKALDITATERHAKQEKVYFEAFQKKVAAASKWTYAQARQHGFAVQFDYHEKPRRPDCPMRHESLLDHAITQVRMHTGKFVTAKEQNKHGCKIHYLLTYDETVKANVCL